VLLAQLHLEHLRQHCLQLCHPQLRQQLLEVLAVGVFQLLLLQAMLLLLDLAQCQYLEQLYLYLEQLYQYLELLYLVV
jgi:hypothetical protein